MAGHRSQAGNGRLLKASRKHELGRKDRCYPLEQIEDEHRKTDNP